jgi:hypothetical protein
MYKQALITLQGATLAIMTLFKMEIMLKMFNKCSKNNRYNSKFIYQKMAIENRNSRTV